MPGDQCGEHPGKAIHPQIELEAEFRNPGCLVLDHPAVDDLGVDRNHEHQSGERDAPGQVSFCIAGICGEQDGKTASAKRQRDEDNEERRRGDRHSLTGSGREVRFVGIVMVNWRA